MTSINKLFFKLGTTFLLAMVWVITDVNAQDSPRRAISPERHGEAGKLLAPYYNPKEPVDCEVARLYIDDALNRAVTEPNKKMIFIIRSGQGENDENLSQLRLKQIKAYLSYRPSIKTVIAVGEKAENQGVIEIYFQGELLYILPLKRNEGLNLHECIAV